MWLPDLPMAHAKAEDVASLQSGSVNSSLFTLGAGLANVFTTVGFLLVTVPLVDGPGWF